MQLIFVVFSSFRYFADILAGLLQICFSSTVQVKRDQEKLNKAAAAVRLCFNSMIFAIPFDQLSLFYGFRATKAIKTIAILTMERHLVSVRL